MNQTIILIFLFIFDDNYSDSTPFSRLIRRFARKKGDVIYGKTLKSVINRL
jgi:hypothetical protein